MLTFLPSETFATTQPRKCCIQSHGTKCSNWTNWTSRSQASWKLVNSKSPSGIPVSFPHSKANAFPWHSQFSRLHFNFRRQEENPNFRRLRVLAIVHAHLISQYPHITSTIYITQEKELASEWSFPHYSQPTFGRKKEGEKKKEIDRLSPTRTYFFRLFNNREYILSFQPFI